MTYIDEIGLEREVWLLDKNNKIVEPAIFSFPHDDFGFLIEIRTRPHTTPKPILEDLKKLTEAFKHQAKLFNLKIVIKNWMPTDYMLIKKLQIKYNYANLHDLTENVNSGVTLSHATGILGDRLSAGIHVHFSRKLFSDGRRVQLPIRKIVQKMDEYFAPEIRQSGRFFGEYEIKPYGFEYRSLPATTDPKEILDYAFTLFP